MDIRLRDLLDLSLKQLLMLNLQRLPRYLLPPWPLLQRLLQQLLLKTLLLRRLRTLLQMLQNKRRQWQQRQHL
jgi:hypothetical protein